MKNKTVLLLSSLLVLIVLFFFVSILSGLKKTTNIPNPLPTPTPVGSSEQFNKTPLKVLQTNPTNGALGVSINQPIIVTFNNPVATNSVVFSIFPEVNYTLSSRLDDIIVTPVSAYQESTQYTYGLSNLDGTQLLKATFSVGPSVSPTIPLTGRYPNLDTVSDSAQRQTYPDIFLAGYVPYQTNSFSVSSDFSSSPSGHYVFTVSQQTNSGKQDFLLWLKQLGLTQDQINRIEITYQ